MIQFVGDILDSDADIICQQVNCCGVMNAGLAKHVAQKYPFVKKQYMDLTHPCSVPPSGGYKHMILGTIQTIKINNDQYICNMFGQLYYGRQKAVYTDYEAFENALKALGDFCTELLYNKIYNNYVTGKMDAVTALKSLPIKTVEYFEQKKEEEKNYSYTELNTRVKSIENAFYKIYNELDMCDKIKLLEAEKHFIKPKITVAFPSGIGCGLANGDWKIISALLLGFEIKFKNIVDIEIWILEGKG